MLSETRLEAILQRIPQLTIAVLGDLFLDRYLDIDTTLTEKSLETGLDAYQVVQVRSSPGAAGTVINNLAALGVGRILPVSLIGDDGEGYELLQALAHMPAVEQRWIVRSASRRTPTYTKPLLQSPGQPPLELNRLDIKNRHALPSAIERQVLEGLREVWSLADALLVLDQVSEPECGVVTAEVRNQLQLMGQDRPERFILADSRKRIGKFRHVALKPNRAECLQAAFGEKGASDDVRAAAVQLARTARRVVFCTLGEQGMLVVPPDADEPLEVPAYPVTGPIDVVGAGDSSSAAIACAVAAGASFQEAAALGNLVASITIQQIGTTGTATPEQVRRRLRFSAGGR